MMLQTFLPYESFSQSAKVLDRQRLGKQRVEVKQILNALLGETDGWKNHPATKMWEGHEKALAEYGYKICEEWISRGYKDSLAGDFFILINELPDTGSPEWLGNDNFHASHRSNLLRKAPEHYSKFGWVESSDLEYVWPAK
jgi:hypothetical protein